MTISSAETAMEWRVFRYSPGLTELSGGNHPQLEASLLSLGLPPELIKPKKTHVAIANQNAQPGVDRAAVSFVECCKPNNQPSPTWQNMCVNHLKYP